ncbi:MAG TPA: aminotransferase class I/II-fold pyridoxal phosphate-dependent enzyme [Blastocatellia bacterium]|nr:aminotransferase class I/II-fold pyridoxal phosphate-dependent enzyme [Blastocatellia bacterium]
MNFQNFDLEYYQSQYEHRVEYNLADSSVKCTNVREWLDPDEIQQLLETGLFYPEVNGTRRLRERVAALYPNTTPEQVLITVGASQANHLICTTLLEPGDEVIVISPGYRQVWGLARNLGCRVKELQLYPEDDWRPRLDELESLAGARTKLIAVVNPNNPTGTILSPPEMRRIVEICARTGAWLHADEVYQGTEWRAESEAGETPSFWGGYDRLICTNSLSKAYGLAGLRIGWAVAAPELIESLWRRHEYSVIAAAGPSMTLAEIALQPHKRRELLQRQQRLSKQGHEILTAWLEGRPELFSARKAEATSIGFVRYHFDRPSLEVAEQIRKSASVLVAPGSYLGAEHHLRITLGYEPEKITTALQRIEEVVASAWGSR